MDYRSIITAEPGKRSGKPCIRGMRITVSDVLDALANGLSHQEVLQEYPYPVEEDIRACLTFAANLSPALSSGEGIGLIAGTRSV